MSNEITAPLTIEQTEVTAPISLTATVEYGTNSDMLASVYDPALVQADVFDQDSMVDGTTNKNYTATEQTKLSGVEASADVTDVTNVTAAGALMDSEVASLAAIKDVTQTSGLTISANWEVADEVKFDAIEALADVTDTANVTAAGALMDSELTSIADVKSLDQSVVSGASPTFAGTNLSGTASGLTVGATTGVEAGADVTDTANVTAAGALMDSEVDADIKTLSLPASTTISAFGATLVDDASASAARTTLGSVIGTDVQAYDTDLAEIAGLSPSQYDTFEHTGSAWAVKDGQIATSIVIVRSASDLSGVLDSSKVYVVDGVIDMGSQQIAVPSTGLSIRSTGSITGALTSTEAAYTMFTGGGTLVIIGLALTASGAGSKVFGIDSTVTTDILSIEKCAFVSCTEIGTVKDYAVVLIDGVQDVLCGTGFTFDGNDVLISVTGCSSSAMSSGGILYKAGGTLAVSNKCLIETGTYVIDAGVTLCDFIEANFLSDAGFVVAFNDISGAGTFFSNLDGSNVKCRWRDNNFDPASAESNTYVGSHWVIESGDEAPTSIATAGIYVKVAGVTTYDDQQWFSNTTNNAHVFDSSREVKAAITASINYEAVSGGADKNITFTVRHWDDSAGAYVDLQGAPRGTAVSGGEIKNMSVLTHALLNENDRVELWVQNDTDTVNLTVKDGSVLHVTERAN